MAQETPAAAPDPGAVRIVLFGMPDAGKSSLLGALAQAAQTQEHVLNGRLLDQGHGLVELQRRLYEERPRQTLEEVAPFPVRLEPFPQRGDDAAPPPLDAVLFDCDGRVANELLTDKGALQGGRPRGELARAVLRADTLILVVDAAADPATLQRDFGQFALFLRLLEQGRGQRTEVGGLPVYLILTKCDLLAHPTDTAAGWMDRIEERKRQVDRSFQEFLARQAEREHMPFGKVELHLWATAVKRPALADAPARPREPYGVAELFRQCLASGVAYREHRQRAESRLQWTVGLVGAVVSAMALLAGFLFLSQPSPEAARLAAEIGALKAAADALPPEKRLRGPLEPQIKKLQEVRANLSFANIPQELQDFVAVRLEELKAYQRYAASVEAAGQEFRALHIEKDPQALKKEFGEIPPLEEQDLQRLRAELEKLPPPNAYQTEWARTKAVEDWKRWLGDVKALAAVVERTQSGYEKLLSDARKKLKEWDDLPRKEARVRARKFLDERAKPLPDRDRDAGRPVHGEVTYAQVFRVPGVAQAYEAWAKGQVKKQVESIAELGT